MAVITAEIGLELVVIVYALSAGNYISIIRTVLSIVDIVLDWSILTLYMCFVMETM